MRPSHILQRGAPGPTWGDREFLPTARRPGRTRNVSTLTRRDRSISSDRESFYIKITVRVFMLYKWLM